MPAMGKAPSRILASMVVAKVVIFVIYTVLTVGEYLVLTAAATTALYC